MESHIQTCERCLCFKSKPQKTELYPITATHPLELIHMDFLTVESCKTGKDVNILVVTDHFTWYVQAFVTHNRQHKSYLKHSRIHFLCTMVSLRKFSVIRDAISKVNS